jgi:hypothetical protein
MTYNVFIKTAFKSFNLFTLPADKLEIVKNAYLEGKDSFVISGTKHFLSNCHEIKIYTFDDTKYHIQRVAEIWGVSKCIIKTTLSSYVPPKCLADFGDDVTSDFIGDNEFGCNSAKKSAASLFGFIDEQRINELNDIKASVTDFDLTRLIQLCQEINSNYETKNFISVAMLCRALIDHIPPIFNKPDFTQFANSSSKSNKKTFLHLDNSLRNIADGHLHTQIRKKEILPSETQIDFKNDLDVLIAEIIRHLK